MSQMGYRSRLPGSVLLLTGFYSFLGAIAFWSLGPQTLQRRLVERGLWDVETHGTITPFNAADVATSVLLARMEGVVPWAVGGVLAGLGVAALVVALLRLAHYARARSVGGYRGLSVTLSTMPVPAAGEMKKLVIEGHGYKDARYSSLLHAVLGYLKAHEFAYCGEGHEQGLFAHTLNVVNAALELDPAERDPLLLLAAAAHDMGKSTAYAKQGDTWVRVKYHDKESARILASFDEWWRLPMPDRSILLYAVKHAHSPGSLPTSLPGLTPGDVQRMGLLLSQLRQIDGKATAEEKEVVRENLPVEDVVIEAFLRSVATGPFQKRGLAKGIQALGWRDGSRLYVLERAMREYAMGQMSALHAAVLGGKYRDSGEVADFTKALLAALDARGWLIKEAQIKPAEDAEPKMFTLPSHDTLWRLQSGTHTFNGVYIVELPEDERHIYPKQTLYELTLLGPLNTGRRPRAPKPELAGEESGAGVERQAPESPAVRRRRKKPAAPVAPEALPKEDIPKSEDAGDIKLFA